jgi:metallo-beta-lactamase family protein
MKLTFHGAAGEVTGSQHLIETDNLRVLLDCGFFQGSRAKSRAKNERFRCEPRKLDGVVLSHAHIDHSGNLPGLYRAGFRGPIFCTRATADIAGVMLRDSAKIQAEDARYLPRHLKKGHPAVEPLYNEKHVREVEKLFEPLDYGEWHELSPEFKLRFSDAGHILGSAISEMQIEDAGDMRRVVFTGDLGRRGLPLLRDPTLIGGCDVLISESTYGNKVHPPLANLKSDLLRIITDAANNSGRVIIPAFSLGRTQQIVYFLNELMEEDLLPEIPVFVDSPLATRLTEVYRRHQDDMDEEAQQSLRLDDDLFEFPGLEYVQSRQESTALNRRKGPFVVISASGMCENGRVVHHLKHAVADSRNTIVIIGYQATHTLGRRIVEREPVLRIFDHDVPLRAKVEVLNGLSAHADAEDFKWWYEHMASETGIGQAFLVHGETKALEAMAGLIRDYCDEDPIIPELHQSFEV